MDEVTAAYERRAGEYVDLIGSVGVAHPSDRQLVDSWADDLSGRALDAGCGPGHWTGHLAARGLNVRGIDRVPAFLEHARANHPGVHFALGNINDLEEDDASLGGVLSWFSTIHHEPARVSEPISEFARVLVPGGSLLLGFFHGTATERFDHAVTAAYRWPSADMESIVEACGFEVIETRTRTARGQRAVAAMLCRRSSRNRLPAGGGAWSS